MPVIRALSHHTLSLLNMLVHNVNARLAWETPITAGPVAAVVVLSSATRGYAALFILSTCKFNQEAGTCCWPQRLSSSSLSSSQAHTGYKETLRGSVQPCGISRGLCSLDERPADSHQVARSLIECKLGFTVWRARQWGEVHPNPPSGWLLLNNNLLVPYPWCISVSSTNGCRNFWMLKTGSLYITIFLFCLFLFFSSAIVIMHIFSFVFLYASILCIQGAAECQHLDRLSDE